MLIHFSDGRQLTCETVHSRQVYYNGTNREQLTFVFPEEMDISTILDHFTSANCKQIYLEDDSGEKFLHENYTIRMGAGVKERGTLIGVGEDLDHRMVSYVEMIRTTYAEQQLEMLNDVVDMMLIDALKEAN
ncbi:MAG: hypothetical protein HDT39_04710 [Lachnospiraceae bacterium]|nr:hypothetical protein [Lachnospiraceae bacterium]